LGWDRRHQLVFNLGVNVPLEGKPFSTKWLKTGWAANLLSQALSGLPYSPTTSTEGDIVGQEFSKNSPWNYTTDLNVSRSFNLSGLKWKAIVEIRNLFNAKNVLGWDRNQNTIDTYLDGKPGYVNDATRPNYGQNPKSGANPDAWDIPRLIRAGLAVEF
jgi:hypothetical protein